MNVERCEACGGHGLQNGMDGPTGCGQCGGEGVVVERDDRGRFVARPADQPGELENEERVMVDDVVSDHRCPSRNPHDIYHGQCERWRGHPCDQTYPHCFGVMVWTDDEAWIEPSPDQRVTQGEIEAFLNQFSVESLAFTNTRGHNLNDIAIGLGADDLLLRIHKHGLDCGHEPLSFSAVNALLLSFAKRNEHGLIDWPGARPVAEAIVARFVGPETLSFTDAYVEALVESGASPKVVEAARKTTTPENYIPSTKDTRRCRCGGWAGSNGSCGPSGCLNVPA